MKGVALLPLKNQKLVPNGLALLQLNIAIKK